MWYIAAMAEKAEKVQETERIASRDGCEGCAHISASLEEVLRQQPLNPFERFEFRAYVENGAIRE